MRFVCMFSAFAEELIEGVEKSGQRFSGTCWCNHQRMFTVCRHMPGL